MKSLSTCIRQRGCNVNDISFRLCAAYTVEQPKGCRAQDIKSNRCMEYLCIYLSHAVFILVGVAIIARNVFVKARGF